jgi:hypothetical protein
MTTIVSISASAIAQSEPPSPALPAAAPVSSEESGSPVPTPASAEQELAPSAEVSFPWGSGGCTLGPHEGINEPVALATTRIVCKELKRQGGQGSAHYVVGIQRQGSLGMFSIAEVDLNGTVIERRQAQVPNSSAVTLATPALVRALLWSRGIVQAMRPTTTEVMPPATANVHSYRALLAFTYIVAPFAGVGLADAADSYVPFVGVVALAPAVLHFGYGHLLPGVLAPFGVAAGILVPYAVTTAGDCRELSCFPAMIAGVILGYTAWAVFDVIAFGEVAAPNEPAARRAVSPTIGFRLEPVPNGFRGSIGGRF